LNSASPAATSAHAESIWSDVFKQNMKVSIQFHLKLMDALKDHIVGEPEK
jgi:hypothetical protein